MKKFRDYSLITVGRNLGRLQPCNKKNKFFCFSSQTKELLNKQTSFLCTLSGGQDSILAFFLFLHNKKKENLNILYCQHLWQLKNFFAVKFLFQLSFLNNIPYILILPQNLVLTENESRDWRQKNFYRISKIEYIQTSLTGHTQTDILEKNLNNLLRGTSPAGLSGLNFLNFQRKTPLLFSSTNLNLCFFF
jgi:tRNA(Ile)-lysidine synthase TilS/MesJ